MNESLMTVVLSALGSALGLVAGCVCVGVLITIIVRVMRWIDTGDSGSPRGASYWFEDSQTGERKYYDKKGDGL